MATAELPVLLRIGTIEAQVGAIFFEPGENPAEVIPQFLRELAGAIEKSADEGRAWREILAGLESPEGSQS